MCLVTFFVPSSTDSTAITTIIHIVRDPPLLVPYNPKKLSASTMIKSPYGMADCHDFLQMENHKDSAVCTYALHTLRIVCVEE